MADREKTLIGLECLITNETPCEGCPYYGSGNCRKNIAKDARELLKDQEPRVLTFDEVKKSPDRLMWLQFKSANASDGYEMHPTAPYADDDPRLRACVNFQSGHVQMKGLYGKQWRCWTAMPEKERLEKWDD